MSFGDRSFGVSGKANAIGDYDRLVELTNTSPLKVVIAGGDRFDHGFDLSMDGHLHGRKDFACNDFELSFDWLVKIELFVAVL